MSIRGRYQDNRCLNIKSMSPPKRSSKAEEEGSTKLEVHARVYNPIKILQNCTQSDLSTVDNKTYGNRSSPNYYRAMHFSAKRGIAIACRLSLSVCLSVCPSVCDDGGL